MKKITETIVNEINDLLAKSEKFLERYKEQEHTISSELYQDFLYFSTRVRYIFQSLGKTDFKGLMNRFHISHVNLRKCQIDPLEDDLIQINSALTVAKLELENGLLFKTSELARLEVFSSFLEAGKYLLDEGWKDAAAVIIGGVLEDKLRNMCTANGLPTRDSKTDNYQ